MWSILADIVVVAHLAFVAFALVGGAWLLHHPHLRYIHIPAVLWAVAIEWFGFVCPLTPLENWLRYQDRSGGYEQSFVEHYLWPILYPQPLTADMQIVLGVIVFAVNIFWYGRYYRATRKNN